MNEFIYEPGVNDAEYIMALRDHLHSNRVILTGATKELVELKIKIVEMREDIEALVNFNEEFSDSLYQKAVRDILGIVDKYFGNIVVEEPCKKAAK